MSMIMTYKGIPSTSAEFGIRSVTRVERNVLADVRNRIITIPGRDGVFYFDSDLDMYVIDINFVIVGDSYEQLRERQREVALWLKSSEPERLAFNDEPEKFWRAVPISVVTANQIYRSLFCTVSMGVPEVFALSVDFSLGTQTGFYEGTHPAPPRVVMIKSGSSVDGFILTYETTGVSLRYLREVLVGDVIEIDMERRTFFHNGIDRRVDVAIETDAIIFEPRDNFELTIDSVGWDVTTQWRARWV